MNKWKCLVITTGSGKPGQPKPRGEDGKFLPSGGRKPRNEYSKIYYKELRLKVLQKYSAEKPYCSCCSENTYEFLTLDHINGGGKKERNKRPGAGLWLDILRAPYDPTKYQVLCYNCNCVKKFDMEAICPHKRGV